MGTDEPDVHHAVGVVDPSDQSVLIACNIENHSPIPKTLALLMGQALFEDAGMSKVLLYISWCAPIGG